MKKIIILFLALSSYPLFSQLKITGYFDSKIGLSYEFAKNLQTELRMNDNLGNEFNAELSVLYKIISKENYNINLGLGISTFPFHSNYIPFLESTYIPTQIEIMPFNSSRNFILVLETAYHFSDLINGSGIRNSIGIRYRFN